MFLSSELSTESSIEAVNGAIPPLKLERCASLAKNIAVLQEYFDFYGYQRLPCTEQTAHYAGIFESAGIRIFANLWCQQGAEHSALIIHGLFDHTGLFLHVVEAYLNAGFNVLAFDLPGHGLSQGERACIDDFHQYGLAVNDFLALLPPELSYSLSATGQSTGCAAIMSYLQHGPITPKSMVYLAPLVRPNHWQKIVIAHRICQYFTRRIGRRFSDSSHNPEFTHFLEYTDSLQHPYVELNWIAALRKWVAGFDELRNCDVPTLLVQGTGDKTIDWKYNIVQIKNKYSALDVKYLESAMHHLANESEHFRTQMLAMSTDFIRSHL
ncbi:MAG: alpha/beta hydrolase [Cellvibrionaceae bacterium]|nr:alpha/beta hydrolase [Cellvibrionaceae bacterium]